VADLAITFRVDARPLIAAIAELGELCRGRTLDDIEGQIGRVLVCDGRALDDLIETTADPITGKVRMAPSRELNRVLRVLHRGDSHVEWRRLNMTEPGTTSRG
jgi:hypothetical protein